jgi:hypothetical protein
LSVKPAGNSPTGTDQVYGAVPPEAASVAEYAVPTVPGGNVELVIVTGVPTTIERALVAVAPAASATRAVKFAVPAADGVPLMIPAFASRLIPAGIAPALMDHEYGATPPVRFKVAE